MKKMLLRALLLAGFAVASVFSAAAADLVQKNAFAYDIRVNSTDKYSPTVTYKLNGLASAVKIQPLVNGKALGSAVNGTIDQTNSVKVPISATADGPVTFQLTVTTANTVTKPTNIKEGQANVVGTNYGYKFYAPLGIAVNNSPNSMSFGQIVVSEGGYTTGSAHMSGTGGTGRGPGLYPFDPQMQPIANSAASGKYGYSGALNMNVAYIFNRIRFSEDGRLFMYTFKATSANNGGAIYEFQSGLNTSASDGQGFNGLVNTIVSGIDKVTNIASFATAATNQDAGAGFSVWGSGANLKLGVIRQTGLGNGYRGRCVGEFYDLGTATSWSGNPSKTIAKNSDPGIYSIQRTQYVTGIWDKGGNGFTAIGRVGTPSISDAGVKDEGRVHYNMTGTPTVDFEESTSSGTKQFGGQVYNAQYNRDYSLLAVAKANGLVEIYKVTWPSTAGAAPTYTLGCSFTLDGATTNDVAFDYANNVYVGNRSSEYVVAYQLPKDVAGSSVTVPSPASQSYTVTPPSLVVTGTSKWDSTRKAQTATIKWNAVDGASTYNVYFEGELVEENTTNLTYTGVMPLVTGAKNVFEVAPIIGGKLGARAKCVVYHQDYTPVTLSVDVEIDSKTGRQDAVLTWVPPMYGTVTKYIIFRYDVKEDDKGNIEYENETRLDENVAADATTFTDPNLMTATYAYKVRAQFRGNVFVGLDSKGGRIDHTTMTTGYSAPVTAVAAPSKPVINLLETFPGRNTVRVHWTLPYETTKPKYYNLYRDGVKVVEQGDYRQVNDFYIPNGQPTYTVEAVYANGARIMSDPVQLEDELRRDAAVTQYGIEEVYDYPIVSQAEADERGLTAENAFITDRDGSEVANMHLAEGAYGTRGGIYRTAKFKNGKWYIAQMHDRTAIDGHTSAGIDYAGYNEAKLEADCKGGIIEINAHDDEILKDGNAKRVVEFPAAVNQYIACDEAGGENLNLVVRSATGNKSTWFYGDNAALDIHHYNAANDKWTKETISLKDTQTGTGPGDDYIATNQIGRVHYLSTDGQLWSEKGGYIYMAMNRLPFMYVINCKRVDGHEVTSVRKYNVSPESDHIQDDGTVGHTENFAFPIQGRNDFIWQQRSCGYYYVNYETGDNYRLIDDDLSRNAGGLTFIYNHEIFFIHPNCSFSLNNGNFVIDMPYRNNIINEDIDQADFNTLIPIAAWTQDGYSDADAAGNANGQWYGFELDEENDCGYIYLYVPGVRFAKYRIYSTFALPSPEPQLDVKIKHDNEDAPTEITHFDATITWQRPKDFAFSGDQNDWDISHYRVELFDANMNLVKQFDDVKDEGYNHQDHIYTLNYEMDELGNKHINEQRYTVHVTPVYVRVQTDSPYYRDGDKGIADDETSYEAAINKIEATSYTVEGTDTYRVDIDVEPADKTQYPEPVSHFALEYSTDGGKTWSNIPNLWIFMNGGQLYASPEDANAAEAAGTHNHSLPGTYRFTPDATAVVPQSTSAIEGIDKGQHEGGNPSVAFYYTDVQPNPNIQYRATAHYAAGNNFIAKSATTPATTAIDGGTTGVADVTGDAVEGVSIYPVPAVSTITARASEAIRSVRIYSMNGSLVKTEAGNDDTTMTINISELPEGNYVVIVNDLNPVRMIKK